MRTGILDAVKFISPGDAIGDARTKVPLVFDGRNPFAEIHLR
jgi:hypothetical protein